MAKVGTDTMNALARFFDQLPSMISNIKRTEIAANLEQEMVSQERDYQFELHKYDRALEDRKFWQNKHDIVETNLFNTGVTAKSLSEIEQTKGLDEVLTNIDPASSYRDLALNEENKASYYKNRANLINDTLSELELIGSFIQGAGGYGAGDPTQWDAADLSTEELQKFRGYEEGTPLSPADIDVWSRQNIPVTLETLNEALTSSRYKKKQLQIAIENDAREPKAIARTEHAALIGAFGDTPDAIEETYNSLVDHFGLEGDEANLYLDIIQKANKTTDPQALMNYINHPKTPPIVRETYEKMNPLSLSNMENRLNEVNLITSQVPNYMSDIDKNQRLTDEAYGSFDTAIMSLPQTTAGQERAYELFSQLEESGVFTNDINGQEMQRFFTVLDTHFDKDMGPGWGTYLNNQLETGQKSLGAVEERRKILDRYTKTDGTVDEIAIYNALNTLHPLDVTDYGASSQPPGAWGLDKYRPYIDSMHESQRAAYYSNLDTSYQQVLRTEYTESLAPDWWLYGPSVSLSTRNIPEQFQKNEKIAEYWPEVETSAINTASTAGANKIKDTLSNPGSKEYWQLITVLEDLNIANLNNSIAQKR